MNTNKEFINNSRIQLNYFNEKDKNGLIIKGWLLTIDVFNGKDWFEISKMIKGKELKSYKKLLEIATGNKQYV